MRYGVAGPQWVTVTLLYPADRDEDGTNTRRTSVPSITRDVLRLLPSTHTRPRASSAAFYDTPPANSPLILSYSPAFVYLSSLFFDWTRERQRMRSTREKQNEWRSEESHLHLTSACVLLSPRGTRLLAGDHHDDRPSTHSLPSLRDTLSATNIQ